MVLLEQLEIPTKYTIMLLTRKKYARSASIYQRADGKKILRLEVMDEEFQKKYSMDLRIDTLDSQTALNQFADELLTDLVDNIYEASKNALQQVKDSYASFLDIFMG